VAKQLWLCSVLVSYALTSCTTELVRSYSEIEDGPTEIKRTSFVQLQVTASPDDNKTIAFSLTAKSIDLDWGDGSTETLTPNGEELRCTHCYSDTQSKSITVGADELTTCFFYGSGGEFPRFEALKLSDCPQLVRLVANSSTLTSLVIDKTPSLAKLRIFAPLKSLDFINGLPALKELRLCTDLSVVTLSNPNLEALYYYGETQFKSENLTSLDVSGCSALRELECNMPNQRTLNVGGCTALERLTCSQNLLTQLDVRNCTALKMLNCSSSRLTALDLSHNRALEFLVCLSNRLATLDLSANSQLNYLNCSANALKTLEVSANPLLEHLDCSSNALLTLNLTKTTVIQELDFSNNRIDRLSVAGNKVIRYVNCHNNLLSGAEVNELFRSLPQRTERDNATITVSGNLEGTVGAECDITIASAKRWKVLSEKYRAEENTPQEPEHRER
jgi:hypothetical protein